MSTPYAKWMRRIMDAAPEEREAIYLADYRARLAAAGETRTAAELAEAAAAARIAAEQAARAAEELAELAFAALCVERGYVAEHDARTGLPVGARGEEAEGQ